MSLLWVDGFNNYGAAGGNADAMLLSSGYQRAGMTTISADTRTGTGTSLKLTGFAGYQWQVEVDYVFPGPAATAVVGFAAKYNYVTQGPCADLVAFQFVNVGGVTTTLYAVGVNSAGSIVVHNGATVLFTSRPGKCPIGSWFYLEAKLAFFDGEAQIVAKVNNQLAAVADDLAPTGTMTNQLCFGTAGNYDGKGGDGGMFMDDLYICDGTGSAFNDIITGPVSIYTLLPVADAGPNMMAQVNGVAGEHWSTQLTPDDDASYLWTLGVGDTESFTLANPPPDNLLILAMGVRVRAMKESAALRKFDVQATLAGNLIESARFPLSTTYTTQEVICENSPAAGQWKISDVSQLQVSFQTAAG